MAMTRNISLMTLMLTSLLLISVAKSDSSCRSYEDCETCIRSVKPMCNWCEEQTAGESRCLAVDEVTECKTGELQNLNFTLTGSNKESPKQDSQMTIEPRKNYVTIRAGDTVSVPLTVEISDEPKIDLYYLTDVSDSMKDDINTITSVAVDLGEAMKKLSKNFRMGFGTYVDKKMLPFYDVYATQTQTDDSWPCAGAYGFCNAMPLREYNVTEFKTVIDKTKVMDNQDAAEGGFDALLQVLKCDQTNWNAYARKIVLFTTDQAFHYAGDGKLAGISKVNDGLCHYDDRTNSYDMSLTMDYPSVYQIKAAAKEKQISIVFGVVQEALPLYKELSKKVELSRASAIAKDSSNIIKLITDEVQNITSKFTFEALNMTDELNITFTNNCTGKYESKDECEGLNIGDKATITASITLKKCPPSGNFTKKVLIGTPDLNNYVEFHLSYLCDCNCTSKGTSKTECNNSGTFKCGKCTCDQNRFGSDCSCNLNSTSSDSDCKVDGTGSVCAGKGQCICGKCNCDTVTEGGLEYKHCSSSLCSSSDFSCGPTGDNLCNQNGKCVCGQCECYDNYSGTECDCAKSTDMCETGGNGTICSGNGFCECNKCICNEKDGEFWYFGEQCEKCRTCGNLCSGESSLTVCVKYRWRENVTDFELNDVNVDQYRKSCKHDDIEYNVVPDFKIEEMMSYLSECVVKDDKEKCEKKFWYNQPTEQEYIVYYTSAPAECPGTSLYLIIGAGVVAAMILTALIGVLSWLGYRYYYNKMEVQEFQRNLKRDTPKVFSNPGYNNPTQKITNPMFEANSQPGHETSSL